MAYRTYSAQLEKSDAALTLIAAGQADSVLFTRSAYYAALGAGSHVLSFKRAITLGIDGQLISADGATVIGGTAQGVSSVRIGSAGSVIANGGVAFQLTAEDLSFTNGGEVSGSSGLLAKVGTATITNSGTIVGISAVSLVALGATVTNTGAIVGSKNGLSIDGGTYNQQVTNSGLISGGRDTAIDINAGDAVLITNTGTVTGRVGINLDMKDGAEGAERLVVNAGTLAGTYYAMFGSVGADTLRNEGRIVGAVNLFNGDDDYDGSLGSVSGVVDGASGDDRLTGGAGRDRFDGGEGEDTLAGSGGNDTLVGGAGADYLDGGEGRDIASYRDESAGLFLYLGEGLYQGDGDDTFVSIEGLEGGSGNDVLSGSSRSGDWLMGGAGDDSLNGQGGADTMFGGLGDDQFTAAGDNGGAVDDRIVERAGEGTDTVLTYADYTLPDNVERLILQAYAEADGYGNALDNELIGSLGSNLLDGKGGRDTLTGRAGSDVFQFSTALGAGNVDTVIDFAAQPDSIALSRTIVGNLPTTQTGQLLDANFRSGAQALDPDDRIIFNPANDGLYFDPDGSGSAPQVLIAFIKGEDVTVADLFLAL